MQDTERRRAFRSFRSRTWRIHHAKSDLVIRTQIYLTDRQRDQLTAIARTAGRRQSELIREAVDRFIEQHGRDRRQAALRDAAGI